MRLLLIGVLRFCFGEEFCCSLLSCMVTFFAVRSRCFFAATGGKERSCYSR
ncbi:hypothetical protein M758_4G101500 [Ceratodon purpureus]|nr:hypothetical protein M758_4G101500 [Ceratodon purpureus]